MTITLTGHSVFMTNETSQLKMFSRGLKECLFKKNGDLYQRASY